MLKTRDIINKFSNVQTLPHVAIRLNKLLTDDNSSMMDFEKIIKMDPSLVLLLLRVVNSAYFGMSEKVDNIARAVMVVGMKNLRNMVVATAIKGIFNKGSEEELFLRGQLWLHSVAVSICSKMISERLFGLIGEDVYLCGLLHDIGLIAEDQVVHELILQVIYAHTPEAESITDREREIIGTDHCKLGHMLAKEWKLPMHVLEGIKDHHNLKGGLSPSSEAGIIQMADYLVSSVGYPAFKGMKATISPDLKDYIYSNADEFKLLMRDFPDEMSTAEKLFSSEETEE